MENYPDFEKLVHIIQHGLQGFLVKSIEGVFTKLNPSKSIGNGRTDE